MTSDEAQLLARLREDVGLLFGGINNFAAQLFKGIVGESCDEGKFCAAFPAQFGYPPAKVTHVFRVLQRACWSNPTTFSQTQLALAVRGPPDALAIGDIIVVQGASQTAELGEGKIVGERENGVSFKVDFGEKAGCFRVKRRFIRLQHRSEVPALANSPAVVEQPEPPAIRTKAVATATTSTNTDPVAAVTTSVASTMTNPPAKTASTATQAVPLSSHAVCQTDFPTPPPVETTTSTCQTEPLECTNVAKPAAVTVAVAVQTEPEAAGRNLTKCQKSSSKLQCKKYGCREK